MNLSEINFRIYNELMISLLVSFFTSFIISFAIIRTQKFHGSISWDRDLCGPQKFHKSPVPRVGGLAIFLGLLTATVVAFQKNSQEHQSIILLACALPVFGVGFAEDLTKKISVKIRLIYIAIGALIAILFLDCSISRVEIPGIDFMLSIPVISIAFTIFAITGLVNAYNIIDGLNGLSSMTAIISLITIGLTGIIVGDPTIQFLSLIMCGSICGFFLINYPRGLIFLGDGGAYLIGFWVAVLSILLVDRNPQISPWFAILINSYPITETIFSIYRRKYIQKKKIDQPDRAHLHSLIYRRLPILLNRKFKLGELDRNSLASSCLWLLVTLSSLPAILFFNSTYPLMLFSGIFCISYLWLYSKIMRF